MADQVQKPVAIRVMRPYSSEDEFLEHEIETLTRTSVVLIGAQSRPQGVVLRFEVVLENGNTLLRGEGRVVSFKPNAFGDSTGLTLRFTRLDTRSKALVDRAAAIRDARARAALDASMTGSGAPPAPSAPPQAHVTAANVPLDLTPPPSPYEAHIQNVPPPPPSSSEPILVASTGEIPAASVEQVKAIANREEVLDRLRDRRKGLSEARLSEILALKRRG